MAAYTVPMTIRVQTFARTAGTLCRSVVVSLLSGRLTGQSYETVEARLAARSAGERRLLVGGVLLLLFLLALFAAQFGWVGMLLYWLAVILAAR